MSTVRESLCLIHIISAYKYGECKQVRLLVVCSCGQGMTDPRSMCVCVWGGGRSVDRGKRQRGKLTKQQTFLHLKRGHRGKPKQEKETSTPCT